LIVISSDELSSGHPGNESEKSRQWSTDSQWSMILCLWRNGSASLAFWPMWNY
jgi:hypothetical protein